MSKAKHDKPKCEKCGGRTALMSGYWHATPDPEPYQTDVEEKCLTGSAEEFISGHICDDCGHVQDLTYEG